MTLEAEDVRDAIIRSWWEVDRTDGSAVHEGYADDGVFQTPAVRLSGSQELESGHRARHARGARLSRHLVSNLVITGKGESARALYVITLFSAIGESPQPLNSPRAICDVEDVLVLTEGRWLITERSLLPVFIADDNDSVMLGRSG